MRQESEAKRTRRVHQTLDGGRRSNVGKTMETEDDSHETDRQTARRGGETGWRHDARRTNQLRASDEQKERSS